MQHTFKWRVLGTQYCLEITGYILSKKVNNNTKARKSRKPHRLAADKAFLSELATGLQHMKIKGSVGRSINRKAKDALDFLESRDEFWRQIESGEWRVK